MSCLRQKSDMLSKLKSQYFFDIEFYYIEDLESAYMACDYLQTKTTLAFDMESWQNNVLFIQLATSFYEVFIFDILKIGDIVFQYPYLLNIFQNQCITKLCFDSRSDSNTLLQNYKIYAVGFYDLQIVYTLLFQNKSDPFLKGYHVALTTLLGACNKSSRFRKQNIVHMKLLNIKLKQKHSNTYHKFSERPLQQHLLPYLICDVVFLFMMYYKWYKIPECLTKTLTHSRILKFIVQSKKCCFPLKMAHVDFDYDYKCENK